MSVAYPSIYYAMKDDRYCQRYGRAACVGRRVGGLSMNIHQSDRTALTLLHGWLAVTGDSTVKNAEDALDLCPPPPLSLW